MTYKLISTDLDGTIFPFGNVVISENTSRIVSELTKKGIYVVPNSGRPSSQIPQELIDAGVRYSICTNGSIIYDSKEDKEIFGASIDNDEALELFRLFKQEQVYSIVFMNDVPYSINIMKDYLKEESFQEIVDTTIHDDNLENLIADRKNTIRKVAVLINPIKKQALLDKLQAKYTNLSYTSASDWAIEIIPKEAGKDKALEKLCKMLDVKYNEVIVLGDSNNDCCVLRINECFKIVPLNGNDNAKSYASVIVDEVEKEGPIRQLEKMLL